MKICLINPSLDSIPDFNLGLAYLISSIEKGHRVKFLDTAFHAKDYSKYILSNLKEFKPDIAGFSVTSFSFHYAIRIASLIRNLYPDIPLVYGGVHPTLLPEETMQNPLVDAICIGEGEDSFKEYLDKLQNNQEPKGVAGIWYKNKSGNIIRNPLRPFREDLDSLTFPNWDYWDMERYFNIGGIIGGEMLYLAARGCPYSCTFCSEPAIRKAVPGKFYRLRSAENVITEIRFNKEKYWKRGFRGIDFGDINFGVNINNFQRFVELYIREKLNNILPWRCIVHPNVITERWCELAKNAGCVMVGLSVESGNEFIRNKIFKKNISTQRIMESVKNLKKFNILYYAFVIIGSPWETKETIKETLDLIDKIKPTKTSFSIFKTLPRTELSRQINSLDFNTLNKKLLTWINLHNMSKVSYPTQGIFRKTKLSPTIIKLVMIKIVIKEFKIFLVRGFKLRKISFVLDIINHIFNFNKCRKISLANPNFFTELEYKTLLRYLVMANRTSKTL